ncbi:MAG: GAF domain-containing protein [Thainema sp.]
MQTPSDIHHQLAEIVQLIKKALQCDRTLIYRLLPNQDGVVAAEAVDPQWIAILGQFIDDPCFHRDWVSAYEQGRISAIDNVHESHIQPCHAELLTRFQVQANLVVPVLVDRHLWGLLIAHQCQAPRQWSSLDQTFLQQVAMQLGLAVQCATLRQQMQTLEQQGVSLSESKEESAREKKQPQVDCAADYATEQADLHSAHYRNQRFINSILETSPSTIYVYDLEQQRNVYSTANMLELLGYTKDAIHAMGSQVLSYLCHPDDRERVMQHLQRCQTLVNHDVVEIEYRFRHADGHWVWLQSRESAFLRDEQGQVTQLLGTVQDISDRKQAEAILRTQFEREHLLHQITKQIRKSLDLDGMLAVAVSEIRQVLQADRVLIFRLLSDGSGQVIQESVLPDYPMTNDMRWLDEHFPPACYEHYRSGKPRIVPDIATDDWGSCLVEFMQSVGVQSKVVAPIVQVLPDASSHPSRRVWGLLIVHACAECRVWQPDEASLLQQIADQLAIAIQQAELHQRMQQLNINLEIQVRERTAQIRQALMYGETLKRLSDRVRDSLDEQQILRTAVAELGQALAAEACDLGLYDLEQATVTIHHDWVKDNLPSVQGCVFPVDSLTSVHQQTLRGQSVQFCSLPIPPAPARILKQPFTILTCPLIGETRILGTLWIFRTAKSYFSDREIWLAEQFANQCAIALRQARLYQTAQSQVRELERLHQLKDDFLSTVSHELRTPMASIKMATHMLNVSLASLEGLQNSQNPKMPMIQRYLDILQEECQRETTLINNLLDLTRLEAGTESLQLTPIQLRSVILQLGEPFIERSQQHQQRLAFELPNHLPTIVTDLDYLERIVLELLNNACKYTPAHGTITVGCAATAAGITLRISNSGTEISPADCDRIFDRFYRIPNNDPWKHGGTGLGLALVKQLVEALQGTIRVESQDNQTHFIVQLPLSFAAAG